MTETWLWYGGNSCTTTRLAAAAEPFEVKMTRLTVALAEQMRQSAALDAAIWGNLRSLGFGAPESGGQS